MEKFTHRFDLQKVYEKKTRMEALKDLEKQSNFAVSNDDVSTKVLLG